MFYRPFGGGVEFGEQSVNALEREIQEELGQAIKDVKLLGVVENIFEFEGRTGHEIIFLYDATFVNEAMYGMDVIHGVEERLDTPLTGSWIGIDDVNHGRVVLYPAAIQPLVTALRQAVLHTRP